MAESCAQECEAFAYCTAAENLRTHPDYFALMHEAVESCIAPIVNQPRLCYMVLESAKMLGIKPDFRPDTPESEQSA